MAETHNTRISAPELEDDLLTLTKAIDLLDVSKQTLYRLMARGDIKGIKVGRQWRFRKADLQAYLDRGPLAAALSTAPADVLDEEVAFFAGELQRLGATGDLSQVSSPLGADMPADEVGNRAERKIIKLVGQIIAHALHSNASDIHLEPKQGTFDLRIRIDGVMHEVRRMPAAVQPAVILRMKTMAALDTEERLLPQDGRIHIRQNQRDYDLRVNLLPTVFGESAVVRILDQSSVLIGMDKIGFAPEDFERLRGLLQHPQGLILATGPTGSGKTTTLYSCLNQVVSPRVKVLSVEDPIEYLLPGIVQVQVNRQAGLTFPTALRAFLRQDPDIIMAGEIRDLETANIIVQAALTGHLVLSTLHTEDAPSAAVRCIEMGVEPFVVASSFLGVVSQRLVRKLCPQCKQPAEIPLPTLEHIRHIASAGGYSLPDDAVFYRAVGCDHCNQRGYRGRTGLYEIMEVTPEVKDALLRHATHDELTAAAVIGGMCTLRADGIRKAARGITTIEEVLRVAPQ